MQSIITPRCFIEGTTGIGSLLRRGAKDDLSGNLVEEINMDLHLAMLIMRRLELNHVLRDSALSDKFLLRADTVEAEDRRAVSSANILESQDGDIAEGRSLIKIKKRRGPKTEP